MRSLRARSLIAPAVEVLAAYAVAFAASAALLSLMSRDAATGLALGLSLFTWWGWPFRHLALQHPHQVLLLALVAPLALALLLRWLTARSAPLSGALGLFLSLLAYYVAGTLYYLALPYPAGPDVDAAAALLLWAPLLAASSAASRRLLGPLT